MARITCRCFGGLDKRITMASHRDQGWEGPLLVTLECTRFWTHGYKNTARQKQGSTLPGPTPPPGHLKPPRYRTSAWSSCILDPLWILNLHRILTRSAHLCSYTWAHTTPHPPQPVFFSFPPHVPTSSSDPDLASWPLEGKGPQAMEVMTETFLLPT